MECKMSIFSMRFILLFAFFSPVQLIDYKLIQANFNINDFVYKNDVNLSIVAKNTYYKIISSDGAAQTFHIYDIVTMIGTYVEFETNNPKLKIQCIFDSLKMTRNFVREVKPSLHPQTEFLMFMITPVVENCDAYDTNIEGIETIIQAKLLVELRHRFIVTSEKDGSIVMIFTAMHFNVSPVLNEERMLLVVKVYNIQKEQMIMQTFLLDFLDTGTEELFYEYVKVQDPTPVADNMISVVVPRRVYYLYNGSINFFSP